MSYLMAVPVGSDTDEVVVVFEVDRGSAGGDLDLAANVPGRIAARARVSLAQALAEMRPALGKVVETLSGLGPGQTEVEFGLKMGGETGVIVSKGTAEVNFVVRMTWTRA